MGAAKFGFKELIAAFAVVSYICLYLKYSLQSTNPLQEPTESQIKEFCDFSDVKIGPLIKIIHIEKYPINEDAARSGYTSYEVVAIFKSSNIGELDKLSAVPVKSDIPPAFAKHLDLPKNNKNEFDFYREDSSRAPWRQLSLTVSNHGEISYAYYNLVLSRKLMIKHQGEAVQK